MVREMSDLDAILHDVPEENWLQIIRALQNKCDEDNCKIQSWFFQVEGYFKTVYQASADLINRGLENLKLYGELLRVLDICQQNNIGRSGSFVQPPEAKVRERGPHKVHRPPSKLHHDHWPWHPLFHCR